MNVKQEKNAHNHISQDTLSEYFIYYKNHCAFQYL